jgi:predicted tellurium resistance membrane protein TerC
MKQPQSITSLPPSPDAERHQRMLRYGIAMGIRVACIIACFFVQGWWLLLPILGAVILPYIAVVLANVGTHETGDVLRPGSIVPVRSEEPQPEVRPDVTPDESRGDAA